MRELLSYILKVQMLYNTLTYLGSNVSMQTHHTNQGNQSQINGIQDLPLRFQSQTSLLQLLQDGDYLHSNFSILLDFWNRFGSP